MCFYLLTGLLSISDPYPIKYASLINCHIWEYIHISSSLSIRRVERKGNMQKAFHKFFIRLQRAKGKEITTIK